MYYVLARSALLFTGAGGIYFFATTGDVPLWFIGISVAAQVAFFIVKRTFRSSGIEGVRQRALRRYESDQEGSSASLEARMLAAAEKYKSGTGHL